MRLALTAGLLAALLAQAGGCASTCREVADQRRAFLAAARPASTWHAGLSLPFATVNRLMAPRLASVPPLRLAVPAPLGALLPPLLLFTRRLELRPAPAGKVGFRMELEVSLAGRSAFAVTADLAVIPRVNRQHELELALRPADIERVEPRVAPDALSRLGELLWRLVPDRARGLIPRGAVEQAAGALVTGLGAQLHRLLRATLLPRLGEVTGLRLALPRYLPVEALSFHPLGPDRLLALVRTGLPVSRGLTVDQAGLPGRRIRLLLPGATLAALTNWGMAEGLLPSRFDASARPARDGANEIALSWGTGPRPLKVTAWRIHRRPCGEVLIGGEPDLQVRNGSIEVGVREARVERVTGSLLLQAAVWLRAGLDDSLTITRKVATDSRLSVGGLPLRLVVVEGGVRDGLFWVGLELRDPP